MELSEEFKLKFGKCVFEWDKFYKIKFKEMPIEVIEAKRIMKKAKFFDDEIPE